MAHHLLHCCDRGSVVHCSRSEGVPEVMKAQVCNSCPSAGRIPRVLHTHVVALWFRVGEQIFVAVLLGDLYQLQFHCGAVDRDFAILIALGSFQLDHNDSLCIGLGRRYDMLLNGKTESQGQ